MTVVVFQEPLITLVVWREIVQRQEIVLEAARDHIEIKPAAVQCASRT